jgi:hypothetical protein
MNVNLYLVSKESTTSDEARTFLIAAESSDRAIIIAVKEYNDAAWASADVTCIGWTDNPQGILLSSPWGPVNEKG